MKKTLLAFVPLLLFGCKPRQYNEGSNVQHAEKKVALFDQPKYRWVKISRDEMIQNLSLILGEDFSAADAFPEQHATTKQIQFWLTALHKQMVTRYGARIANIPEPQALVIRNDDPNAFVSPALVCSDAKFSQIKTDPSAFVSLFLLPGGRTTGLPCTVFRDFLAEGRDFSDYIKQNFFATTEARKCKVDIAGRVVTISSECRIASSSVNDKLGIFMTNNFITIHSSLIENFTEPQVIGVLAHELGHYYNSHSTVNKPDFEYFYQHSNQTSDRRPLKANQDIQNLGAEVKGLPLPTQLPIEGAVYQSDLYTQPLLNGKLLDFDMACSIAGAADECIQKCAPAMDLNREQIKKVKAGQMQGMSVNRFFATAEAKALVSTYSKLVETCTKAMPANMEELGSPALGLDNLIPFFISDKKVLKAEVDKLMKARDVDTHLRVVKHYEDLRRAHITGLHAKAFDKHISFYTTEQEADEVAVEYLSYIGFKPETQIDMTFALLKLTDSEMAGSTARPTHISEPDCRELFNNEFVDKQTNRQLFVNLGGYTDTHHGLCFRVFNLWRENKAHSFKPQSSPLTAPARWNDIQTQTKTFSRANLVAAETISVDELAKKKESLFGTCELFQNVNLVPVANTKRLKASDLPH